MASASNPPGGVAGRDVPSALAVGVAVAILVVGGVLLTRFGGVELAEAAEPVSSAEREVPDEPDDGEGGPGSSTTTTSSTTTSTSTTSTSTSTTTTLPPEQAAALGLQEVRSADRSQVAGLEERWVAQVGSKYVGLEADGIVYDDVAILAAHEALVAANAPEPVVLLWSGDYSTFRNPEVWVSVVGRPFGDAAAANAWCDAAGIDPDHCFAKLISTTAGVEGSTVYRD